MTNDWIPFLKHNLSTGDEHRRSTNLHFFNVPGLAFHVEIDAAGTVNKVTLFNDKFIPVVLRFQSQSAVMNEISTQGSAGTASRWIFRDIVCGSEEACVRASSPDLERLTCERMATRRSAASVNIGEQRCVDTAVAQVCE